MLRDSLIVYDDGTPRTKHITTNVVIEVDEEAGTAISRSYFTSDASATRPARSLSLLAHCSSREALGLRLAT